VIIVASAVAIVLVIAAALRALPERLRPAVMRTEPVTATEAGIPEPSTQRQFGDDESCAVRPLEHSVPEHD